jgi:hypothetical protein
MFHRRISGLALAAAMLCAQESNGPRLTAREIFYGAKPPEPKAAAKKTEVKSVAKAEAKPEAKKKGSSASSGGEVTHAILAADTGENVGTASNAGGLAMRWSIVQNFPGGSKKEVPTTTEFRSGDSINVRVEVNDVGYLYIFARGSSGKWTPLFPSAQVANGDNRVSPNYPYLMPHGYVFKFDNQPGTERIFVVFSRKPEPDFDGLIYKVAPERPTGLPKPEPGKPAQHPAIILAQNTVIGDPFVDRVKTMYARDLIVEKAEGEIKSSLGPKFEYAAYVATQRRDDPRVVAEVNLVHK